MPSSESESSGAESLISRRIREARDGNRESLVWLVEQLTPLIEAQATLRLGPLAGRYDPRDLVQDAWLATIPRLRDLQARDGRLTPVLVKFLATTVMHKANHLLRDSARHVPADAASDGSSAGLGLDRLPADITGPVTRAIRQEQDNELRRALADLSSDERRLFILRAIEGIPNRTVAALLDEAPNTIAQRYRRVLLSLRERLRGSVLDEVETD